MEKPNHLREALARLEARRIELEREIVDEIERKFFSEPQFDIDLTASIYDDPPLTAEEQAAWDDLVARL